MERFWNGIRKRDFLIPSFPSLSGPKLHNESWWVSWLSGLFDAWASAAWMLQLSLHGWIDGIPRVEQPGQNRRQ
jgi:hypothetical protein